MKADIILCSIKYVPQPAFCVGCVAPIITLKHGAFDSSIVIWTISSLENPLEFRV